VPSAGRTADPDVSLVVRVSEISTAPTPQERAASDRSSARWERVQQAYRDCGLYTITGIHDAAVAECIERRTS